MKKSTSKLLLALSFGLATVVVPTQLMAKKPNILMIWGDDIGQSNISAYTKGLMGLSSSTQTLKSHSQTVDSLSILIQKVILTCQI